MPIAHHYCENYFGLRVDLNLLPLVFWFGQRLPTQPWLRVVFAGSDLPNNSEAPNDK